MSRYEMRRDRMVEREQCTHLECDDGDMAGVREQLLLCVLLIITLACIQTISPSPPIKNYRPLTLKLDPYPMRHSLNSLRPKRLIQLGVNPNITRPHRLCSKIYDGFDSPWSPLFERSAVNAFVQVDCVFAGNDVLKGGTLFAACL